MYAGGNCGTAWSRMVIGAGSNHHTYVDGTGGGGSANTYGGPQVQPPPPNSYQIRDCCGGYLATGRAQINYNGSIYYAATGSF